MRLATFHANPSLRRAPRVGALVDDVVVDLTAARADQLRTEGRVDAEDAAAAEVPADMVRLLSGGTRALESAREAIEFAQQRAAIGDVVSYRHGLDDVLLLAPIPRPPSLRCFLAGADHVRRAFPGGPPDEWARMPVYYKGNCDEIYGPEDTVPWPTFTDRLDYEIEVCAIIGREGRNVSTESADDLIVGYTIFNDWSARDIQLREMSVGLGPSYGKDFASSLGPVIVTKDEFDPRSAHLVSRVDGEEWSSGPPGEWQFSFADIISWVSQEQTLHPGDILTSGPIGGGSGVEHDRWLTEGALVELSVEGIGVLRNRVSARGAGPVRAADGGAEH